MFWISVYAALTQPGVLHILGGSGAYAALVSIFVSVGVQGFEIDSGVILSMFQRVKISNMIIRTISSIIFSYQAKLQGHSEDILSMVSLLYPSNPNIQVKIRGF